MASRISTIEWGLLLGAAIAVDIFQFILDVVLYGLAVNRYIDIAVAGALLFYLPIRGVTLGWKQITSISAAFGLEMIPILDAAPLWSLDVVTIMWLDRQEKKAERAAQLAQEREEIERQRALFNSRNRFRQQENLPDDLDEAA